MTRAHLLAMAALMAFPWVASSSRVRAEEQPAAELLSDSRIDDLCGKLGAADFSTRELATRELIAGGSAVITKVAAAAETDSLEVVIRCLAILKELHQRPDEQTRGAAATALRKLSGSPHRSTARRAAEILNPPEIANATARQIQFRRLNPPGGAAAVRVLQAGNVVAAGNGGTTILSTNGNGRRVAITHQNETNIIVSITHPPGAGENAGKTTVHSARNPAELKEKHPEAYKLYEHHSAAMRRLAGGVVPVPPRPEPP